MPGVAIQPSSPSGTGGFGPLPSSKWMPSQTYSTHPKSSAMPATHNGSNRITNELSVAEIKAKAKEGVTKEARGVSAITLIKTARSQILSAKEHEARGDLKAAFASYIKAATLAKMTLDSPEYVQEAKGKGGVIRKELNDFLEHDGRDISLRANTVEEKLKAMEKVHAAETKEMQASVSIADRMRALQDNGLSLGQTKIPHHTNLPTPPVSPRKFISAPSISASHSSSQMDSPSSPSGPSMHAFVSPSSLGPPSPSSTPSSSPPNSSSLGNYDLNGFTQAFPSIDELDESPAFTLPSVPTGIGSTSKPYGKDSRNGGEAITSPLASFRSFTVPIERPSSTPITPTNNNFSRPPSPSVSRTTQAHRPSGLSNGITTGSSTSKIPIPVKNTAFPKDLAAYLRDHNVLLIDVRNRADFDREHIKGNAVVCIETSVLMRESVTADALENSMVVGPRQEASLFANRDKFDLVAVYDESSTTFGNEQSPLSVLVRAISEQAFKKMLKRMPMLLVGGIEAWKKDMKEPGLVRGPSYMEIQKPVPTRSTPSALLLGSGASTSGSSYGNGSALPSIPASNSGVSGGHELWTPPRQDYNTGNAVTYSEHRASPSVDQTSHTRAPADAGYNGSYPANSDRPLIRRPAILRPSSGSISYTRSMNDTITSPVIPTQSISSGSGTPITYPQFPRHISSTSSGSSPSFATSVGQFTTPPAQYDIASPPPVSINPSQLSRKRSDFIDQSQEALSGSGFNTRSPPAVDYPDLTSPTIVRPPPVAAPTLERKDNRPRIPPSPFSPMTNGAPVQAGPKPPRIQSDYAVNYWPDTQIGTSGLKNLGNTCYMNAPIQCLSATVPFARFFTEGRWKFAVNYTNPLGSKGKLAGAFAKLLHEMWGGDLPYLTPIEFRKSICQLKSQYNGSDQHDSQEFLSFLMDGIHEDLNRILAKPTYTPTPEEEAELERLPPQIASDREWTNWRSRNDSLVVDFFQGQFRNRLECLTCHKTSTTYNVFSILQLPIPNARSGKVPIERCLDAFFNEEVLEKDDAWDCPQCKAKRRASKKLSLARLPPVLMIHLKRFEANGRFSDKIDTFVEFPMKSLDLTNYMPPPLPPGADKSQLNGGMPMSLEDPRTQLPPYRYDLYGVTNHYGNLSSGHYTAFIASRGGWMYCDDSSVKPVDPKQVVGQKAYVLFYKRVKP
ncbi:cysteine proteinase [Pholiota conissans]|uniref:ubiquitinyl hydrolase 1 n=1 Tax=Pholiota conissans TaxID=109636 RepID=A0A9P5YTF1_9AGAR|nr:cysteine proteinase [Pholiota conissans]